MVEKQEGRKAEITQYSALQHPVFLTVLFIGSIALRSQCGGLGQVHGHVNEPVWRVSLLLQQLARMQQVGVGRGSKGSGG